MPLVRANTPFIGETKIQAPRNGGFFVPIRLTCLTQGLETETSETSQAPDRDPWLALGEGLGVLRVSSQGVGNQNALEGHLRNRFGL